MADRELEDDFDEESEEEQQRQFREFQEWRRRQRQRPQGPQQPPRTQDGRRPPRERQQRPQQQREAQQQGQQAQQAPVEVLRGGARPTQTQAGAPAEPAPQQQPGTQVQLDDIRRELREQRDANESRERRIRAHASVTQAAEHARHRYHLIASKLRQTFVPYRIAYELQQRTIEAHQKQIEAERMFFIGLFFAGVAGFAGGVIQSSIKDAMPSLSGRIGQYVTLGTPTAAADIQKYIVRLVPSAVGGGGGLPTAADGQAPPDANPGYAGVEPIGWLEGLMGRIDEQSSEVSRLLSELAAALARGEEPQQQQDEPQRDQAPGARTGPESAMELVARILQPVERLSQIAISTQHQYGEMLWSTWLREHWIDDAVPDTLGPGQTNERIIRARGRDDRLLEAIKQQCGGREPYLQLLQARFAQSRIRAGQQRDIERERQARQQGLPTTRLAPTDSPNGDQAQ